MLYLYGLLGGAPGGPLGAGLEGKPVRWIDCGACVALVSDLEAAPPLAEPALRAHDEVVRVAAAASSAILPARFGACLADDAELSRRLAPVQDQVAKALALVSGCVQMTLRVYGGSPGPQAVDDSRGPGTRYLASRVERAVPPELAPLREALAPLVRAERVVAHAAPPLRSSVHHLIERAAGTAYAATVAQHADRIGLEASGPWPPYAFAGDLTW